jgi:hypothetical protein
MALLKVFVLAIALVAIVFAAMSIRLLFKKNGEFSGGSCSSSPGLRDKGVSCGCGGGRCVNTTEEQ